MDTNNQDLAYLQNSGGGSSNNLNSSDFFEEVYPELHKNKNEVITVFYIDEGNDSFSLNLSSLDNGLYHIHISNKNKARIEKIIVNNPSF